MRRSAIALTITLGLTACTGTDEAQPDNGPSQTVAPTTLLSAEPETSSASNVLGNSLNNDQNPTTTAAEAATTEAPSTSEETTTTETIAAPDDTPPEELALDGTLFVNDAGTYSMIIPADWDDSVPGLPDDVDAWFVGPTEEGFTPNVNVLSLPSFGLGTEEYTELGVETLTSTDDSFEVLELTTIQNSVGVTVTRLVMQDDQLKFLQYSFVEGGEAITLTLTAPISSFDRTLVEVDPYILSLQPE